MNPRVVDLDEKEIADRRRHRVYAGNILLGGIVGVDVDAVAAQPRSITNPIR